MIDISGEKVTKKNLSSYVRKIQPTFIMINGHGNDDCVTGHDNEVLVKKGENENVFKNTIVFARSCSSANGLGLSCSKNVNTTYIGYTGDYYFMFDLEKLFRPLTDKTAEKFLEPSNYVAIWLLKGLTAEEANRRSKNMIRKNILQIVAGTDPDQDLSMLPLMIWNYNHQVCFGDPKATIR
ncbi:hypothetical protein M1271_07265 [Patescibacteria group bacterium]|nr:hypothetical protein [Patescibacteria group bacterium]